MNVYAFLKKMCFQFKSQIEEGWGGYLEWSVFITQIHSTQTFCWRNLCYKNVMGQNKIMCIVITESIGKMDQEGRWGHFNMDSYIILCIKSQITIYYKMWLLPHLNKEWNQGWYVKLKWKCWDSLRQCHGKGL